MDFIFSCNVRKRPARSCGLSISSASIAMTMKTADKLIVSRLLISLRFLCLKCRCEAYVLFLNFFSFFSIVCRIGSTFHFMRNVLITTRQYYNAKWLQIHRSQSLLLLVTVRYLTTMDFVAKDRKKNKENSNVFGMSSPVTFQQRSEGASRRRKEIVPRNYYNTSLVAASGQENNVYSVIIIDRFGPILKWPGGRSLSMFTPVRPKNHEITHNQRKRPSRGDDAPSTCRYSRDYSTRRSLYNP